MPLTHKENAMVGSQYALGLLSLPGGSEWIILLIIALLIFGKRLPEIARGVGKSLTEFKKGVNEGKDAADDVVEDVLRPKSDAKDASDAQSTTKTH
jgi:sec-independent protein translocase protein TatA